MKYLSLLFFLAAVSCQYKNDSVEVKDVGQGRRPVIPSGSAQATESNYLSGRQFCEYYKKITDKEFGRYISVPLNHEDPQGPKIELYVYSLKPFDPKKPSYIFIDGGPGQNTHGILSEYTDGDMNELRFDQRGLGCSAFGTFSQYKTPGLYSTRNTVQDLEKIRESLGISQWSVYGVSYGTVPATEYAHLFPQRTQSVVLEGTFAKIEYTHDASYKAEKLNQVISQLSEKRKLGFDRLMLENSEDSALVQVILGQLFYQDHGLRSAKDLLTKLISDSGEILREKIKLLRSNHDRETSERPQAPGVTDSYVMQIIYCRDLGYRQKISKVLRYSPQKLFYAENDSKFSADETCKSVGVPRQSEDTFKIDEKETQRPVYYFQGSHDGATMAEGAFQHWLHFAKGPSYFMLAEKGGHNPNLDRLESENDLIGLHQKVLFGKSLMGEEISEKDIESANAAQEAEERWFLFLDAEKSWSHIIPQLDSIGIHP